MDTCRRTIDNNFPPVVNATLFVYKDGSTTMSPGGKMPKYRAKEILDLVPQIKKGDVKVFITWLGEYRSDIFELDKEDVDRYVQGLNRVLKDGYDWGC